MPFGLRIITKNLFELCKKYGQEEICQTFIFECIWLQCLTASDMVTPILAVNLEGNKNIILNQVILGNALLLNKKVSFKVLELVKNGDIDDKVDWYMNELISIDEKSFLVTSYHYLRCLSIKDSMPDDHNVLKSFFFTKSEIGTFIFFLKLKFQLEMILELFTHVGRQCPDSYKVMSKMWGKEDSMCKLLDDFISEQRQSGKKTKYQGIHPRCLISLMVKIQ